MEKIIHYCWFGGKPLPKLAKKCIKSWKKFLPDYKIMEWNENNFDINITNFSKQAYKEKKWAFVSDVARVYALKNFGGIYFDTDMIVTKNINDIIDCEAFAGWESEYNVAVGVLGASKNNELINKLWNFYCQNDFSVENVYSLSIPTILTNILKNDYDLKYNHLENQTLKGNIKIYARDYFYPISCDNTSNMFTQNTCMIHYYVGSWLSSSDKKRIKFQMLFGKKTGNFILNILVKIKHMLKKFIKFIFYPIVIKKRKQAVLDKFNNDKNGFDEQIKLLKNKNYIVFFNKNWLGTQNATKELFENTVGIEELFDENLKEYIANYIVKNNFKLVVFSAFSYGWSDLIKKIKSLNPEIVVKVIWHGSNAMNVEYYDWKMFETVFKLHNMSLIDSIGFVKKSMYDFYKIKGYRAELILNTVHVNQIKRNNIVDDKVKIGLYASGDRWVKNFYNQLGAASLFNKCKIDCIPLGEKALKMANIFKVSVSGLSTSISHDKLLERMSKNDINFYATFSECAPLIPLESLELGVPCITGNNHHYWENTELEKYLLVNETDNCLKIYEQAKKCLENKDKILKLYKEWKQDYDKKSRKSVDEFLKIKKGV
jgi:mannosyltransferase OCH1-like enzyme